MYARNHRTKMLRLGATSALALAMLAGCAGGPGARADLSGAHVPQAVPVSVQSPALAEAEAAVLADPRNSAHRIALGNAYLDAGRFSSAATSFEDAMTLGQSSPRLALSLALAWAGQGRFAEATSLLNEWDDQIAAADLGLAMALSGQPERGIHILSNAIRQGQNTVKVRQNLAYAYAVAGRWREARLMVQQDVPAGEVGNRIAEWAQLAPAEAYQHRIAALLQVPASVRDTGQPVQLALADHPALDVLVAQAGERVAPVQTFAMAAPGAAPVPAPVAELPPVPAQDTPSARYTPAPASAPAPAAQPSFAQTFTHRPKVGETLAQLTQGSVQFDARPVAQAALGPRSAAAPSPAPARAAVSRAPASAPLASGPVSNPTHLVQLGSFTSEQGARRAWSIYLSRHPGLADHQMVITQAVVRGRNYWRVSAAGFDRASSRAMCSRVSSSSGEDCITWAENRPLPGAIDRGVHLARR